MSTTRRTAILAAGAMALALAASGCASDPGSGAEPTAEAPASVETTSASPAPAPLSRATPKAIGELGGIGCDEAEARACDLEFAVTDIEPGVECAGVVPEPGTQLVRFTVAATTRAEFAYPGRLIGGVLEARNWGVTGPDGTLDARPVFASCPGGQWGLSDLGPGARAEGTAVLVAPIGARALRLDATQAGGPGWQWAIPGPVTGG